MTLKDDRSRGSEFQMWGPKQEKRTLLYIRVSEQMQVRVLSFDLSGTALSEFSRDCSKGHKHAKLDTGVTIILLKRL